MAGEDLKKELKKQKPEVMTASDLIAGTTALNLATPEPWIKRKQAVDQAKKGIYPKTECLHPISMVVQMYDHVNEADRHGRPTNWFECEVCHSMLFLVDPYGRTAQDG